MTAAWIVIPDWPDYVHPDVTRSGNPPAWLRLRTRLHHDDAYMELSGHDRAVLVGVLLEYASSRCRLRADTRSLSARLQLRVTTATLQRLANAGFLEILQAPCKQDASLEVEVEVRPRAVGVTSNGTTTNATPAELVAATFDGLGKERIPW